MNFENCTPHSVNLLDENGVIQYALPAGRVVPRLSQSSRQVDVVNGVSITETEFGVTQDLPEPTEGCLLIVSRLVLAANPDRNDLVVPNELVRDEDGNIIGCKSLSRN